MPRNSKRWSCAILAVSLAATPALGQGQDSLICNEALLADSVADFTDVQGASGWSYGYYDGDPGVAFTPDDFELTQDFRRGWQSWELSRKVYWTILGDSKVHPNGTTTSGGRNPELQWVVRRWIANCEGAVDLCGTLAKVSVVSGDGVDAHLFVDGVVVWSGHVDYDDTVGITFTVPTQLKGGSVVDLAVSPGPAGHDWDDSCRATLQIVGTGALTLGNPWSGEPDTTDRLEVHNGSPGAPLILVGGTTGPAGGGAPGSMGSAMRYAFVDQATADPNGHADFRFFVPPSADGLKVHYIALDPVQGKISNTIVWKY